MSQRFKNEPTEFKYVVKRIYEKGHVSFIAILRRSDNGVKKCTGKSFDCIREAAIAVDKYLINQGKEPVNILVRK